MASQAETVALHPIRIQDVLTEAVREYRRHFRSYLATMALCQVPIFVLFGCATVLTELLRQSGLDGPVTWIAPYAFNLSEVFVGTLGGAAVVQLSADAVVGRPLDVSGAYGRVAERIRSVAWTTVIVVVLTLLCLTIIGIPFVVYRMVGWSVSLPAIMIEGHGATAALRRSARLVGGQRWRVIGSLLPLLLLPTVLVLGLAWWCIPVVVNALAAGTVLGTVPISLLTRFVGRISVMLVGSLVGSLGWIGSAILFHELRGRHETGAGVAAQIHERREQLPQTLRIALTAQELASLIQALESEDVVTDQPPTLAVGSGSRPGTGPGPALAWRMITGASSRDGASVVVLSWADWDAGLDVLEAHIAREPNPPAVLLAAQRKIEDALIGS